MRRAVATSARCLSCWSPHHRRLPNVSGIDITPSLFSRLYTIDWHSQDMRSVSHTGRRHDPIHPDNLVDASKQLMAERALQHLVEEAEKNAPSERHTMIGRKIDSARLPWHRLSVTGRRLAVLGLVRLPNIHTWPDSETTEAAAAFASTVLEGLVKQAEAKHRVLVWEAREEKLPGGARTKAQRQDEAYTGGKGQMGMAWFGANEVMGVTRRGDDVKQYDMRETMSEGSLSPRYQYPLAKQGYGNAQNI
ncbi:hypothetical protein BDV98DRAFT_563713 [Pterulicium gracile]|uniref:Uncharacterized protein n=1 Tax=Pterulicium gracile TaxID=1884261 RepID=A0A5C3QUL7_9AGAR|nr:hypothetical protein BDV98DRAFT_563713 [Pterula gracilis]